ncbi:shikimate kinase [Litorimonas taeanensis]|uniref:Shikimate kinase n=1 Tax=Litorimonas taeanensis TaxID=568099 RepID=A0A420WF20_9PROT|nr:shikimate kinase [Litorimonas taeanensis]RKQ69565.1 shikimate kinase [Litorimonas taeanensis]
MPRQKIAVSDAPNIALIGMMGVGKTTIGRRLARRLSREFFDSDHEIEKASGRTVAGYFRDHGEAQFREGEKRVINRLVDPDIKKASIILATGGGAFTHEETREILNTHCLTVWLKGDLDTLFERVSRNNKRPLLQVENPRAKLQELIEARHPIYAQAHIHVPIAKGPHIRTVNRVIKAIQKYQETNKKPSP